MVHVPYNGTAAGIMDTIAGNVTGYYCRGYACGAMQTWRTRALYDHYRNRGLPSPKP